MPFRAAQQVCAVKKLTSLLTPANSVRRIFQIHIGQEKLQPVREAQDRKNSHSGQACIPSLHVVHSVRRIICGLRLGLRERRGRLGWLHSLLL